MAAGIKSPSCGPSTCLNSKMPIEGLLYPSNVLDTLGADAPEKLCKATR